ncbi:MAG: CheA signal transduction histidine kinase [Myxococcales bacterium]|nr:CheA signal transduction histidine kinase [Myxococcales bacterium]
MAKDPYKYFRIEAHDILDQLGKGLLDLEKLGASAELVARLLRLAHTLKGAARIVKHAKLAEGAHAMEDALEPLRQGATAPIRLDGALALLDAMAVEVAALPKPGAGNKPTVSDVQLLPRADTAVVDEVLGGLAELHALVGRLRAAGDPQVIAQRVDQLERELRSVRQDAELLRFVPISTLFTPLERTARDAAATAAKQVTFSATGGDVRLDAQMLGALHAGVVQLVRNAVAHGIETPAVRAATRKSTAGHVEVGVRLHGSKVVVTCTDDGAGVDLDAVRRVAEHRGLERKLDDDQLMRLLLRGGLTTSSSVTELAGRGIGLDVVRETARQLGGEVTAHTRAGRGATFAITVPISVASISALVVEAGGRTAVIPLDAIKRIARLGAHDIVRTGDRLALPFDDLTIAFAPLARLLGADEAPSHAGSVVVIDDHGTLAAVGVTRTRGVETVVVQVLPAGAPIDPIVWGVALDAEGHPRPVLEPAALVVAIQRTPVARVAPIVRALPILIVDDSLTTRMLEQSILESAGYDVDLASSAEEALDKATRRGYALFLVDVEMPGMDGFAFISEIRARRDLSSIPAILVTSRASPEDRRRGAAVGAQGYVIKSEFDQVQLLGMIRGLVRT